MPLASTLAERLNILEKNMVASDEKPFDEELFNMMKCASKTLQRIKSTKKELRGAQRKSRKKIQALRDARSNEYTTSDQTRERINKTYAELELNGKAESLSEWCAECGCIHINKLLEHDHSPKSTQTFSETQHQMMDNLTTILDKLNKNDDK